ncbi:F420-dependent oxidoreductase [Actinoplanes sp. SE50]|uniref:coenzyme F420-0:L-glutamate ligase n=1 Tax=unclassified Actinoplanes TaxID=2626549 RepID=UPI00023EC585|nr:MULTISPECIES: coenzyme F420-0:L-glutamate ligase [unclassified Actinoplanes]AEV81944.1 gamma-glutamyl ligase [Actinoplanes sp. SE50/110]ATO80344.1 F420-dependent oxidoreductase [Actinoplanes sp. SE50]SLL97750.1 F420-0--gamma-glutamyl ligase [Actinoplanes sp. SE50/110]
MRLEVLPVEGIGDVTAGDDLAELITRAAPWLADGDVLVVTSKIVSKAEGRLVEVPADEPERDEARARVLVAETARVVARRGPTTIVQTHHGFVMAAAGIDASNVDKTHLVLLPADPDASARRLRADLAARGLDVAVVISDTMGRAWRNGLTDVALGAAGIEALLDHRGEIDPYGNELNLTQMAVVDELSAAAELVKGKCDQVPVAVVRGYPIRPDTTGAGASVLIRDGESDMFRLGTAEARAEGLRAAALIADGAGPEPGPEPLARVLELVGAVVTPGIGIVGGTRSLRLTPAGPAPADLLRLGADAHRIRAAFAAEGLTTRAEFDDDGVTINFGES